MLLRLKKKVIFSDRIRPACLLFSYANDKFEGKSVWLTGWGQTNVGANAAAPKKLQKVFVPVVSNQECKKTYGNEIKNDLLCTGSKGKGACFGDSGGPAVWLHPS